MPPKAWSSDRRCDVAAQGCRQNERPAVGRPFHGRIAKPRRESCGSFSLARQAPSESELTRLDTDAAQLLHTKRRKGERTASVFRIIHFRTPRQGTNTTGACQKA